MSAQGLVQIEELIRRRVEEQRALLERDEGLKPSLPPRHFTKPAERPFTRDQREHTTVLFGGLTPKHERLLHGVLEGLGYRAEALPTPDVKAFQTGKEFGNNGQCNPTYFTVGNLVQYLRSLERDGLTKQEILDRYIFFTAGACGPCRFGMYEAEYRLALRNSGFAGFRVILFQQSGGLTQSNVDAGLEMNLDFFLGILSSLTAGDVLNEAAYAIRPFEVTAGETDQRVTETIDRLHRVFKEARPWQLPSSLGLARRIEYAAKFIGKMNNSAIRSAAEPLNTIEIDRLRVKPIVKITGEFWAQTTEGDGNFRMFQFLEREGAQVLVEPIGTWIMYMLHQVAQKYRDTKGLEEGALLPPAWSFSRRAGIETRHVAKLARIKLAEAVFRKHYRRMADALPGLVHALVDQYELQRIAHPLYNSRAGGGEGHLEVAKNIYYANHGLAHMVLSLKPFGCMPSMQSDGVQSAVISNHQDMIYLPIETSGEGEINAHSRVQMALGEAKAKAKREFAAALDRGGLTLDQCRAYVAAHPEVRKPFYRVPHHDGVAGVAANFALHIAERMQC
jgi:predicted nucleotide-binding protein (sugar kinase/HSP70/actin superfamily)